MADILQKVISGNDFNNGGAVVQGNVTTYPTIDPELSKQTFATDSGILDDRLDEKNYYYGVSPAGKIRNITFSIDGAGSVLTTGVKTYTQIPYDCTIQSWSIFAANSGSIVIDVWKDSYANYPPTVADTITGTEKPTITSGTKAEDNSLTTWTTSISQGDILAFSIDSVTDITQAIVTIRAQLP